MNFTLSDFFIFGLGFIAQILFFARTIVQWFKSEKAGKVLSPVLFWQISLGASILMMTYGILRKDFAIILGQFITYFIYVRNLQLQGRWKTLPVFFRLLVFMLPLICIGWMIFSGNYNLKEIISNEKIPHWLLLFGISAQVIFTFRFVYQWIIAEKNKESMLPPGFWFFSITGAVMTIGYGAFRLDPVLVLSNLGGLVMYSRNLMLHATGKGIFNGIFFRWVKKLKK